MCHCMWFAPSEKQPIYLLHSTLDLSFAYLDILWTTATKHGITFNSCTLLDLGLNRECVPHNLQRTKLSTKVERFICQWYNPLDCCTFILMMMFDWLSCHSYQLFSRYWLSCELQDVKFKLGVGRMFEYSVYSNVSLIFEYTLKLRIFIITIVIECILYTYVCI